MSRFKRFYIPLAVAGVALAVGVMVSGCDSVESNEYGSLRVLLTDAPFPFDHVAEARVTIERVEIVQGVGDEDVDLEALDESQFVLVSSEPQTFNLLDLRDGITAVLGEVELQAAGYSHVRIHVSDPLVEMKDGTSYPLKVPSSVVKVHLPAFEVGDEGVTELTLDFNVEHSFVVRGIFDSPSFRGFIFKPVVRLLRYVVEGEETEFEGDPEGDPEDSEYEISGEIEALTDSSLTVGELEILVEPETAYENVADLGGLSVGDPVIVTYRLEESGDLVAIRVVSDLP